MVGALVAWAFSGQSSALNTEQSNIRQTTVSTADLAKGTPLRDALPRRKLPEFYQRMLLIGASAGAVTYLCGHLLGVSLG